MLGKNSGQLHLHDVMIYEKMIPKNHLLLKLDDAFDFEFIYELVQDSYSEIGRISRDPVMITKMMFLEYLYKLSDVEVKDRTQTDVAFRWFLKLSVEDNVPDDTTISYFRIHHMGIEKYNDLFNTIVKQCMKKNLIKSHRYQIDSTNIDANVNYPSIKQLIRRAYERLIKQVKSFNETLANESLQLLEAELAAYHIANETFPNKVYYEIIEKHLTNLYVSIHNKLDEDPKLMDAFILCNKFIDQYHNKQTDNIVSIVDQEARVAHKTPGTVKRGYKNSIIMDEESELILAFETTPFNVNDHNLLSTLVDKVKDDFGIIPDEISADKGYASHDNRAFLKDNSIISNIDFYKDSKKEKQNLTLKDCIIADEGTWIICPNGIFVNNFEVKVIAGKPEDKQRVFKVDATFCNECPLKKECHGEKVKESAKVSKFYYLPDRYDAVARDKKRVQTKEFIEAKNARYKIERRFATGVRNHDMRRTRYIGLVATAKHVTMSNLAVNFIRALNLIYPVDAIVAFKNQKIISI